jgi:hypothetical protein
MATPVAMQLCHLLRGNRFDKVPILRAEAIVAQCNGILAF